MTVLTDYPNLETPDYGLPGWVHVYNTYLYRLNEQLLKIAALADVDVSHCSTGKWVLVWSATDSIYLARQFRDQRI